MNCPLHVEKSGPCVMEGVSIVVIMGFLKTRFDDAVSIYTKVPMEILIETPDGHHKPIISFNDDTQEVIVPTAAHLREDDQVELEITRMILGGDTVIERFNTGLEQSALKRIFNEFGLRDIFPDIVLDKPFNFETALLRQTNQPESLMGRIAAFLKP